MSDVVKLIDKAGCAESAEILRDMATQAEKGDVISVTVLYERPDGTIGNCQSGTRSRMRMAGALLDAAVRRLGYEDGL